MHRKALHSASGILAGGKVPDPETAAGNTCESGHRAYHGQLPGMSDWGNHSQSPPHHRSVGRQGSTRPKSSKAKRKAQRETAPLAMPATSPWCQGQLPRIVGGSPQSAMRPSRDCCWCMADGINQSTGQPRLAGTRLQHHKIWGHVLPY
ncbi:hypothetical protein TcCL_ESM00765 [Trypanosoma cruzi]|nr:hypothetical protein TcCL_ESM00765 [Trypanosoma cruzi]